MLHIFPSEVAEDLIQLLYALAGSAYGDLAELSAQRELILVSPGIFNQSSLGVDIVMLQTLCRYFSKFHA